MKPGGGTEERGCPWPVSPGRARHRYGRPSTERSIRGSGAAFTLFPGKKMQSIQDCKGICPWNEGGRQSKAERSYLAHRGGCCLVLHLWEEKQGYSKMKSQSDQGCNSTAKNLQLLYLPKIREKYSKNTLM